MKITIAILIIIPTISNFVNCKNVKDLDSYTKEELQKIAILREKVKDVLTKDYMFENKYLVRFLRVNRLNVMEAELYLRDTYRWRKEQNADNLKQEDYIKWMKRVPFSYCTDKKGRPTVIAAIRDFDLRRAILAGNTDEMRKYIISSADYTVERLHRISNETGIEITNYNGLFNAAGYNPRMHACLPCIPLFIESAVSYEKYYPLLGYRIYAINVPRIFISLYQIVIPFVKEETRNIITIFGLDREEFSRELLKIFPENELPKEYGGIAETKAWNDIL